MRLSRRQSFAALAAAGAAASGQSVAAVSAPIRLVVLDVGGTIIEDRGDVPEALKKAFAKHGITVTPAEIAGWRGASKREIVRHFAGEGNDKLAGLIYADFSTQIIRDYKTARPIAGAEEAFRSMRARGLLLATTTGFDREITASIFQRLGWQDYFAATITSDDVTEGRPAPYMIFHAMEQARVNNVAEVVTVGDTPLDLQAGMNAGVRGVIGVLSGASTEPLLRAERYTHILPSVAELPALLLAELR
ncbi:MAG: HAD hydrolase-like protein [Acidobacteriota bacterium]|nr:HAD hydrolase-like protein [Acidobacteriota bacterium]